MCVQGVELPPFRESIYIYVEISYKLKVFFAETRLIYVEISYKVSYIIYMLNFPICMYICPRKPWHCMSLLGSGSVVTVFATLKGGELAGHSIGGGWFGRHLC